MKRLVIGLLAVAVLLAYATANALCSEGQSEVGFGVAGKTDADPRTDIGEKRRDPVKLAAKDAVRTSGEAIKLAPDRGKTPSGVVMLKAKTVSIVTPMPENVPENVPENLPPENIPPENVPSEKPPEAPPAHIELIPSPPTRLVRAGPENVPGVKLVPDTVAGLELPENMPRLMPAPELPDNTAQVRLMPSSDVPLPENTVSVKPTEN